MLRIVWINKSNWLKPGPIVYMGLLNAMAFSQHKIRTDFFVGSAGDSDTQQDLHQFYGVEPSPYLNIVRVKESKPKARDVYKAAITQINQYLNFGDQVIVLTRELGVLSRLLKIKKKNSLLKVIYESHDYYVIRNHLPKKGFGSWRRQLAEKLLIPKLDGLICLTEHQRALYQQFWPKLPIVALSLGCLKFGEQDCEERRQRRNVTYIGHLHSYKGKELIFDLAKLLKGKGITLSCYGGKLDQIIELRKIAQNEGLEDVLKFEPFVSPVELHRILDEQVSIGLVPLQDTFYSRYLTCPVKALDFLSHGLPVVASDLPSTHNVLNKAGLYCKSNDATFFAKAIDNLLNDAESYKIASQNARNRSDQLLWYLRAEKILKMIKF